MSLADRYTILEKLGEGGMAEVYRAQHLLLEREVAIKFVHAASLHDLEFDQRFKREAQAIAHLEHPNIVHVYDFDKDAERGYFMVMEFLQGADLAEHLYQLHRNEVFMSLAEAIGITRAIADALGYAHKQGVIHRDVKPSNIFLTQQRRVVVTDFGIAKMSNKSAITSTDSIVGTPPYFAPEVASGLPSDHRVDIYATGAVFYQLLTGRFPYDGNNPLTVISQHINAPVPNPQSVREDLPPRATIIVQQAMAKDPASRYQSFADFIADLDKLAEEAGAEINFQKSHTPRSSTRPVSKPLPTTNPAYEGNTVVVTGSTSNPLVATKSTFSRHKLAFSMGLLGMLLLAVLAYGVWGGKSESAETSTKPTPMPTLTIAPAAEGEYLYLVANVSNDQHPEVDVPRQLFNAMQSGNLSNLLGSNFRVEYVDRTIRTPQEAAQLAEQSGALLVVWGIEDATGLEIIFLAPDYPANALREMRFQVEINSPEEYADIIGNDLKKLVPYAAEFMTNYQMLRDNIFLSSLDIARITQPKWGDVSELRIEPVTSLEDEILQLMTAFYQRDYDAIDREMTEILEIKPDEPSLYFMRFVLNGFLLDRLDLARSDIVFMGKLMPDSPLTAWADTILYIIANDYTGLYATRTAIEDPSSASGQIQLFYHSVACLILGRFSEAEVTLNQMNGTLIDDLFKFPVYENLQAMVYEVQGNSTDLAPIVTILRSDRRITQIATNLANAPLQNPPIGLVFWFGYALEVNRATETATGAYLSLITATTPDSVKFLPYWRLGVIAEQAEDFTHARDFYLKSVELASVPFPIAQYNLALLYQKHPELDPESGQVCTLLESATTDAQSDAEFYGILLEKISTLQGEAGCE